MLGAASAAHPIEQPLPCSKAPKILVSIGPELAHWLGQASAIGTLDGPAEGFVVLERIDARPLADRRPSCALRGELLVRLGRRGDALAALQRAASCIVEATTTDVCRARRS
jgi:predicted RNA polymerase sigma factor